MRINRNRNYNDKQTNLVIVSFVIFICKFIKRENILLFIITIVFLHENKDFRMVQVTNRCHKMYKLQETSDITACAQWDLVSVFHSLSAHLQLRLK